jgi:hypothetical protein
MKANIHVTHLWVQTLLLERLVSASKAKTDAHLNDTLDSTWIWKAQEDISRQLIHVLNNISEANLKPNGYILVSSSPVA